MCSEGIDTNAKNISSGAIFFFLFYSVRFLKYFSIFLKDYSGNNIMYYNDQQQNIINRSNERKNEHEINKLLWITNEPSLKFD